MKETIKLLVIAVIVVTSLSFTKGKKKNEFPGTVKFSENLFVDKTEITNLFWKEYISWKERKYGKDSKEYKACLPDMSVWGENLEAYADTYFNHVSFRDYPVVGVSYEQAIDYCNWRSRQVNIYKYIRDNKIEWNADSSYDQAPEVLRYRLPTKEEFEAVAKLEITNHKLIKKFEKKGLGKYNCIKEKNIESENDSIIETTTPVYSYEPNEIGVYNILGNVAEMTNKKGLAKGGSWIHNEDELQASKDFKYEKPERWLGFRCVCEKVTSSN